MTERLDYVKLVPEGLKGFNAAHRYVADCALPQTLVDLVYLRVSQINHCAYCIDLHTRDLQKQGVSIAKISLVTAWPEAGDLFSPEEQAALRWAETVTNQPNTAVPDEEFTKVSVHFSGKELADLTIAVALMNALNRMAVSFRKTPVAVKEGK
jgi:AhpD family alkylhydroperoxidase